MGLTITEKIIAAHAPDGRCPRPGGFLMVRADMLMGNELGTSLAIRGREELLKRGVFDRERVAVIPDHFTPNRDVNAAQMCKTIRNFAREQGLKHYYELGRMGIEHVLLHEKGLVSSGEILVGADSHTCTHGALGALALGVGSTDFFHTLLTGEIWLRVPESIRVELVGSLREGATAKDLVLYLLGILGTDGANYQVLEFCGEGLKSLQMDARFTLCNMAIEMGAKSAIIPPDDITRAYLEPRQLRPSICYSSDSDAEYVRQITVDLSQITYQIACPHSPGNVRPVAGLAGRRELTVDQVFIGGCTNGRLDDLRLAAEMLRGRRVHENTRLIIVPGSQEVMLAAVKEGLAACFIEAGAVINTPSCGACIGGHSGLLAAGERCVSTTNRNFRGRMGHIDSEVYLAGVPVAAASAIQGYIALPEEVGQ